MSPSLIIVSNRLPVSVKKTDGKLEFYPSVGGLATGLSSYANDSRNKWIGWPGIASDDLTEKEKHEITTHLRKSNCYPVFLTKKQLNDFYNGYSNSLLWPLFHDGHVEPETLKDEHRLWKSYDKVNALFAETVLALSKRGTTIWVHDYQLLRLPAMLRAERPDDKIGFFLHIPFPSWEKFGQISHAPELLAGVLGADLVGLHTRSYVANFLECCRQTRSGITSGNGVILSDRAVKVTNFPMGIDYDKYARAASLRTVKAAARRLKLKYRGKKIILTVDRLEPTKGLLERLQAYQELLKQNPKLHGKVVMIMLATPSRTEIPAYKQLYEDIKNLVHDINHEYGTRRWQPVNFMYKSLPFEQVAPLYQIADVAFITPLRDGMNLVAKEFVASKRRKNGVLVLSKTAGAAEELKHAVMVDPLKLSSLVNGLTKAISMPPKELKHRATVMQEHLSNFTVHKWAGTFMQTLTQPIAIAPARTYKLGKKQSAELERTFKLARSRLLLLDYDGVLVPLANNPFKANPSDTLLKALKKLAANPKNKVVLISGRSREDLSERFKHLPVGLVAEHGAFSRRAGNKNWKKAAPRSSWKQEIQPLLEKYAKKTQGSRVEEKETSLVWHYREASPYYAQKHLVQLKRELKPIANLLNLHTEQGNMILEVRAKDVNKGTAARAQVRPDTDFIMAIGDDTTDEDMFAMLPERSFTIKVGRGRTNARFRLSRSAEVVKLLERLAK